MLSTRSLPLCAFTTAANHTTGQPTHDPVPRYRSVDSIPPPVLTSCVHNIAGTDPLFIVSSAANERQATTKTTHQPYSPVLRSYVQTSLDAMKHRPLSGFVPYTFCRVHSSMNGSAPNPIRENERRVRSPTIGCSATCETAIITLP